MSYLKNDALNCQIYSKKCDFHAVLFADAKTLSSHIPFML